MRRSVSALGFAAALTVVAMSAAATAHAAGAPRAQHNLERLRAAGDAALTAKDYDAAVRAYSELYRLTQQPDMLFQLGIVAAAQGHLLDAQDLLRRFLSDPRFDPSVSEAKEQEARRILALPRPPSAKVNIIGTSGTLVAVDQRLVGRLPLARPLLISPGKHTLMLEEKGRRQQEELDAAVGRFIEITYDASTQALLSTELPGVLLLDSYPGLPEAAAQKLGQTVEELVQRERLSPFPESLAMQRAGSVMPSDCMQVPACQCKIAKKNDLEYVLNVRIAQRAADAPWEVKLDLLDAEVEESAARSNTECPACDQEKAAAFVRNALPALFAKARQRPRAELVVTTTPAGAEVRVGTQLWGTAPLSHVVWAGELELELSLSGYATQRLPVTAVEGQPTKLAVTLQPELHEPPPATLLVPPPPPPVVPVVPVRPVVTRPRWRLALGGAVLGVGVVLGGFGSSALSVADTCAPGTPAAASVCRLLFDTTGVGGGLLAAGLASSAAGILLLAIPNPTRPASLTSPAKSAAPAAATF